MKESQIRVPKWTRAAYSNPPFVRKIDEFRFVAEGSIECWRGTPHELLSVADILTAQRTVRTIQASITWIDGTAFRAESVEEVREKLGSQNLNRVLAIRVEAKSSDDTVNTSLVARNKIPGVIVRVESTDESQALGAAELAFRKLMLGYVDRMGSFRAPTWMLTALTPMLVFSLLISGKIDNGTIRAAAAALVAATSIATFAATYRLLIFSKGFELVDQIPRSKMAGLLASIRNIYRSRWTKPILAGLMAIILGIIGNKLSDLIPFP